MATLTITLAGSALPNVNASKVIRACLHSNLAMKDTIWLRMD